MKEGQNDIPRATNLERLQSDPQDRFDKQRGLRRDKWQASASPGNTPYNRGEVM